MDKLRQLLENSKKEMRSETEDEIHYGTTSIESFEHLADSFFTANQEIPNILSRILIEIFLPNHHDSSIQLQSSISFTRMEADIANLSDISSLSEYSAISVLYRMQNIIQTGEICTPIEFIQDLCSCKKELASFGFVVDSHIIISKSPILIAKKKQLQDSGIEANLLVFLSVSGFQEFLQKDNGQSFYNLLIKTTKNTCVCIEELKSTYLGTYGCLTTLWSFDRHLSSAFDRMKSITKLKESKEFFDTISSPGVSSYVVVPDVFSFEESLYEIHPKLADSFRTLGALHTILAFASYAIEQSPNKWLIRLVGIRAVESTLNFIDNEINIDNQPLVLEIKKFFELTSWAFEENDSVKVSIARRTSVLHSTSFSELIENSPTIKVSAEAAYELYINERVSDILEVQQKFSEYLLDWSQRDLDQRVKLDNTLSLAVFGGFTSIVGTIVGFLTQQTNSEIFLSLSKIIPPLLVVYLILSLFRIFQIGSAFQSLFREHLRQIAYYRRILGESFVRTITGDIKDDDLKNDFNRKKWIYAALILFLIIIISIYWLSVISVNVP